MVAVVEKTYIAAPSFWAVLPEKVLLVIVVGRAKLSPPPTLSAELFATVEPLMVSGPALEMAPPPPVA